MHKHHAPAMSASPELHRSPVALEQLFPRQPAQVAESPTRPQHLLPVDATATTTILAAELESPGSEPSAPDHQTAGGVITATGTSEDFTTPTDGPHRIPSGDDSCGCPPAPRKPRPPPPAVPACRRRLMQGDLLRVSPEQVERIFGRTWTRATSTAAPDTETAAAPAVLPAKKRKRCYAQEAGTGRDI